MRECPPNIDSDNFYMKEHCNCKLSDVTFEIGCLYLFLSKS